MPILTFPLKVSAQPWSDCAKRVAIPINFLRLLFWHQWCFRCRAAHSRAVDSCVWGTERPVQAPSHPPTGADLPGKDRLTGRGRWKHMCDVNKEIRSGSIRGKIMTALNNWRETVTLFFLVYFCVNLNRPYIHSFIYSLSCYPVWYKTRRRSCCRVREDGYRTVSAQVPAAGAALRGVRAVGDPEPRGCCGEELRRHPAGVRGEGLRHRHRTADSNLRWDSAF